MVRKVTRDTSPMAGASIDQPRRGDDLGQHDPGGVRTVNASMPPRSVSVLVSHAGAELVELADRVG